MKTNLTIGIPVWLDLMFVWPVLLHRRIRYGFPYRRIPLGEGLYAIVDPLIFYEVNKYHWTYAGKGDSIYAIRHVVSADRCWIVRMHREILKVPSGVLVDHKNLNPLDNRIVNLRPATREQNIHNRKKVRRKTTSAFIGVHLEKGRNVFRVNIMYKGKKLYVGRFKNEIDAARAYDRAALKYHGEFARLNFPREDYIDEFPLEEQKTKMKSYCEVLTILRRLKDVIRETK